MLNDYIDKFEGKKILVVGDIMLDKYIYGEVFKISPEAPVPVVLKNEEKQTLGGATNVVNNLHGLGAQPILCGVLGADIYAGTIMSLLSDKGLSIEGIQVDGNRPTSVKTRVVGNSQQIVRIDNEVTSQID